MQDKERRKNENQEKEKQEKEKREKEKWVMIDAKRREDPDFR